MDQGLGELQPGFVGSQNVPISAWHPAIPASLVSHYFIAITLFKHGKYIGFSISIPVGRVTYLKISRETVLQRWNFAERQLIDSFCVVLKWLFRDDYVYPEVQAVQNHTRILFDA
jgi:hypothetical protein